jgi:vacuolar-type H+-ATPase subunit I/STV1
VQNSFINFPAEYRVKVFRVEMSSEAQTLVDQYHELIGARKAEYGNEDWRDDKLIAWALEQIAHIKALYQTTRVTLEMISSDENRKTPEKQGVIGAYSEGS